MKEINNMISIINQKFGKNLVLSAAYGGYQIQVEMENGGARSLTSGYQPKKIIMAWLDGYYRALYE